VEAAAPTAEAEVPAVDTASAELWEAQPVLPVSAGVNSVSSRVEGLRAAASTPVAASSAAPGEPAGDVKRDANAASQAAERATQIAKPEPQKAVEAPRKADAAQTPAAPPTPKPRPAPASTMRSDPQPRVTAATPVPRKSANGKGLMDFLQQVAGAAVPTDDPPQSSSGKERRAEQPMRAGSVAGLPASVPQEGHFAVNGDRITMHVTDADLSSVLKMLSLKRRVSIVAGSDVSGRVSVSLYGVRFEEALDAILSVNGYTWAQKGKVLFVTKLGSDSAMPLETQGRQVRVFRLNYADANKVNQTVTALLSQAGQSFYSEAMPTDGRNTEELLVVEDLPAYVSRIEEVIKELDRRPRQVMIQARILEITLSDELDVGVKWDLTGWANEVVEKGLPRDQAITLLTEGFASLAPGDNGGLFFTFSNAKVKAYLSALEQVATLQTLSAPRLLALDGQTAKIQVGSQLGYRTTTTTETSTMETVEFLEIGTILEVTPSIADDGNVVLQVKPEVSDGQVNPDTQLPEESTSEAETTLVVADGKTVVIGGLMSNRDEGSRSQVPILGDIPILGSLFRRNTSKKRSREIVVTLKPCIVPDSFGPALTSPCMEADVAKTTNTLSQPVASLKRRPLAALEVVK